MTSLPVATYVEVIKKSGLVAAAKLDEALAEHTSERGEPTDSVELARYLEDKGLLTEWQNKKLLEGRHKGFFLGKHKLLRHLGSGGMSSVYLAEHTRLKRLDAVKILPVSRINDSSYLERFQLEARAIASLDHPNIIRVWDVDNEGNVHFMCMEYLEGEDLEKLVKRNGPMTAREAAQSIRQAAAGLAHAHQRGMIHRDIKPGNLFRDQSGTVKVLDLGLARLTGNDKSLTVQHNEKVLGTADYLSPEQALNSHTVDHRTDLYSLGCTLYFLLTGRPPFPDGTLAQRLMKHQVEEPVPESEFRDDIPEALLEIRRTLTAKNPADRYQTAQEVQRVLSDWLEDRTADVSPRPAVRPPRAEEGTVAMRREDTTVTGSGAIASSVAEYDPIAPASSSTHRHRAAPPRRGESNITKEARPIWQNRGVQIGVAASGLLVLGLVAFLMSGSASSSGSDPDTAANTGSDPAAPPAGVDNFVQFDGLPVGNQFTIYGLQVPDRGRYHLTLHVTKAPDAFAVAPMIDGEQLGEPVSVGSTSQPGGWTHDMGIHELAPQTPVTVSTFWGRGPDAIEPTSLEFTSKWHWVGPFNLSGLGAFASTKYPVEEQPIDLEATFDVKNNQRAGWKEADLYNEKTHKLNDKFGKGGTYNDNVIYYFYRSFNSPKAGTLRANFKRDDAIAIWLNGERVAIDPNNGGFDSRPELGVTLNLRQGKNDLLMKLGQGSGEWGFGMYLKDTAGKPRTPSPGDFMFGVSYEAAE